MAGKAKTRFSCSNCGHEEPKWLGRCPSCDQWNTFVEVPAAAGRSTVGARTGPSGSTGPVRALPLSQVSQQVPTRVPTGIGELDRVLGGGLVPAATVLVGGPPGIGKSTLMLELTGALSAERGCLYVSAEESAAQVGARARRLGMADSRASVLATGDLDSILGALGTMRPEVLVVDSLQTLIAAEAGNVPGTVGQIKYCCHELSEWARESSGVALFVAHVTKEGSIAGPKSVEHMVDTVLGFDEAEGSYRYLRGIKNRFGPTDEIGVFAMTESGLREVPDAGSHFLVRRETPPPVGVVAAAIYEGSRVFLVEIQALTVPAKGGISRVFSDRIDSRRVSRTAAVLEKHLGLSFSDHDIYVNVAGGLRVTEVGVELPMAIALLSARSDTPVPPGVAVAGEVTLAGEVREVPQLDRRVKAAADLGFPRLVGPRRSAGDRAGGITTLDAAVREVFGDLPRSGRRRPEP